MIDHLLRLFTSEERPGPRIPAGRRVYAVGDIHGRADLLEDLHKRIVEHARCAPGRVENVVVYIGDYVDRGLNSRAVLDLLIEKPIEGFESIHLRGNHDELMARFLVDSSVGPQWLLFGGEATLFSYGIVPSRSKPADGMEALRRALAATVPASHQEFLDGLHPSYRLGDYMFVHAGIRPGIPLDRQEPEDLMWIREPFLRSRRAHGAVVVHGHTVYEFPEVRPNRIGIDTGAHRSGRLSCLVVQDDQIEFLHTRHPYLSTEPPAVFAA